MKLQLIGIESLTIHLTIVGPVYRTVAINPTRHGIRPTGIRR